MDKSQAKKLSIEVWQHLADHPELYFKTQLPEELYDRIRDLLCECPLCDVFFDGNCAECPLATIKRERYELNGCTVNYFTDEIGLFTRWNAAAINDTATRKEAAEEIVRRLKAWIV